LKKKNCAFSVKIVAEVFGKDNKLVDKVKFAELIYESDIDRAFKEVQRRISIKAAHRGYRQKNGYHFQYHLYSPFKKLWDATVHSN